MEIARITVGSLLALLVLGGCAQLGGTGSGRGAPAEAVDVAVLAPEDETTRPQARPAAASGVAGLGAGGLRPDALDQTTAEERRVALAPPAARTELLGETLAALGSPGEGGIWLRTGLVTRVQQGRVELQQGTGSLRVELRPSGAPAGAGSQLSLAAFTTLGVPLTQLVGLRVYAE
ncbi:MAG: D-galactarate dehydratase [Rhodobacteraceae bacterium]|nr:MAG: D-galactarate dehydratase [Paracoccaceae bacterium]